MNVCQVIVRYLEDIGVQHLFYIPGGTLIPLTEALWQSNIKLVCAAHETGAAFMAHGYAWAKGHLGVCCFTTGPGATNALTGVATAKLDHAPLLILTAMNSLKNSSRRSFQDSTNSLDGIDTVAMYEKVTHYSRAIYHPGETYLVMQNAIKIALLKQGPVHVSVPTDIGFQEVPDNAPLHRPYQYLPVIPQLPDPKQVVAAAEQLQKARRPVMFVGYGAVLSQAYDEIKKLAERLAIPVMTTMKAKSSFPEDHTLSLGTFGFCSSGHASQYLKQRPDVLLSVGTGFHEFGTESWSDNLRPTQALIQLDADPLSYGCYYPGNISLIGDARASLAALNELLTPCPIHNGEKQRRGEAIAQFKNEVQRFREPEKMVSQDLPLKPQRLMKDLQDSFPAETVYVVDIGGAFCWATHFLTLGQPRTYLTSSRHAPMGFSMAAIGCKCIQPDRPVVAIVGDGAMKMNGMEIATAINNHLPIIFVVLNDGQWGMVEFGHKLLGMKADVTQFQRVDFVKIAEGLGAIGIKITKPGEINKEAVQSWLARQKTIVLDVYIDPTECPPFGDRIRGLNSERLTAALEPEQVPIGS